MKWLFFIFILACLFALFWPDSDQDDCEEGFPGSLPRPSGDDDDA